MARSDEELMRLTKPQLAAELQRLYPAMFAGMHSLDAMCKEDLVRMVSRTEEEPMEPVAPAEKPETEVVNATLHKIMERLEGLDSRISALQKQANEKKEPKQLFEPADPQKIRRQIGADVTPHRKVLDRQMRLEEKVSALQKQADEKQTAPAPRRIWSLLIRLFDPGARFL